MARPQRNNADYFSHDANFRNDPKIRAVRGRFGCAGYGVVSMLLEMLTASDGFSLHWDDIMVELYAGDVGVSASEIQEIVSFCVRIRLFSLENDALECPILTEQLRPLLEKARRAEESEYRKLYSRWERINVREWNRMRKMIFKRDNYTCAYCGQIGGRLEVDHIAPISKGGTNTDDNLTTSCRRCNRQKRDKTVEQFLVWKGKRK